MGEAQKPFRALSSLLVVRVMNALMQFGTLALIARSVSLTDFGGYSASVALGSVLGGVFGFGLSNRVLRIQAESSREVLLAAIRVSAVSAVIIGVSAYVYGLTQGSGGWSLALAGGAYVASELLCNVMSSMLFGEQRRRRAEAAMLLRRGVPFALVLAAALLWPAMMFEFAALGFILAAFSLRILVGRLPWGGWRLGLLIKGSWQFWLTNVWTTLQQLDLVLITSVLGLSAAGGYGAAFRLASPINIVTTSLVSLMIPELSRLQEPGARNRAARPFVRLGYSYAVLIALASPVASWAGPFVFGQQYAAYAPVFSVLFVSGAFGIISQIHVARLYGEGRTRVVTGVTAVGTVLALTLIATGALAGGVMWAAIGFAISQLVLLLALSIAIRRRPTQKE